MVPLFRLLILNIYVGYVLYLHCKGRAIIISTKYRQGGKKLPAEAYQNFAKHTELLKWALYFQINCLILKTAFKC